jgi:ABC-2 type transport system permease protein
VSSAVPHDAVDPVASEHFPTSDDGRVGTRPLVRLLAQTRIELLLTLRRGESVLLTFAIPVVVLAFFSNVDVLPTGDHPVDFLYPGTVALAVLSTALVSLAIATGFERQTGVLKRLGATPLRRAELLGAKTLAIVAIEVLQVVVLTGEAFALGWRPHDTQVLALLGAVVLATVAFASLGLLLAGVLPALTTLAAANGLYLLLLLTGGMIVPLEQLPGAVRIVARALPAGALSDACHGALGAGSVPGHAWAVLVAWAIVAPLVASRTFRWE